MNQSAGGTEQIWLDEASWIEHIPGWLPAADADTLLASLIADAVIELRPARRLDFAPHSGGTLRQAA